MKRTLILIALLGCMAAFAQGPTYLDLEGSLFIWGDHIPGEATDDLEGLSIFINGPAAERLYRKMKAKPAYNECLDDGTLTKSQGMFQCSLSPKQEYSCAFGVSTKEGKVYGAESC